MAEKHRRRIGQWRCATVTLILLCFVLIITVMSIAIIKNRHLQEQWAPTCGQGDSHIDLSEPTEPSIFHDLTSYELKGLRSYLHSTAAADLNLVLAEQSSVNKSFILTADLYLPEKSSVLLHLEMGTERPAREARVIIFRGDNKPPEVQEYIVGPLPDPEYHYLLKSNKRKNPIPDAHKPYSISEFDAVVEKFVTDFNWQLSRILLESYDATFINCENKCLRLIPVPLSPEHGESPSRRLLFQVVYDVNYHSLFPVDLIFLFQLNGTDFSDFFLEQLIYADQKFNSIKDFQQKYIEGSISKTSIPYPTFDTRSFSKLEGGETYSNQAKRKPRMIEPDGVRYNIRHKKVDYMKWKVNFRLSPLTGPVLYDVHFGEERIAYEISLQEIATYYSSSNTGLKVFNYVHGSALLGTHAKSLIPGSDCPETSTFISSSFMAEKSNDPFTTERSMCIFEQNSGTPLRRHMAYSLNDGGFYDGMLDTYLVVRTIIAIANHDYIIDYILHQNGALETKVTPAGYFQGMFHTARQERFGFQLREHLVGNIHHQLFNFKVDLDIFGTSNRYQTLDIHSKKITRNGRSFSQIMYKYDLKQTELEARFKADTNIPTYHLFYNKRNKSEHRVPRAMKVEVQGSSKLLLQDHLLPWAQYQIAVTKYRAEEMTSSSPYAAFDASDPVVNFTKFLDDNDSLIDTDLVLWITMGMYKIPHSEDLPLSSTVGKQLSFYLIPFNYFSEEPSISSRDTVRAVHNDTSNPADGIQFIVDKELAYHRCITSELNLTVIAEDPDSILQSKNTRTIY